MSSRVLLVEDDYNFQQGVAHTLADEQIETVCTGDSRDALFLLNEASPDVLIAKIGLPDKNGYELCRYVREEPEFQSLPVVLLDSHFDSFNQSAALSVGADVYLSKPFEPGELVEIVRKLLDEKKVDEGGAVSARAQAPIPPLRLTPDAQAAMTNAMPEAAPAHQLKGRSLVFPAALAGVALVAIGLAVLERTHTSPDATTRKAGAASELSQSVEPPIEAQQFAEDARKEWTTDLNAEQAAPPGGSDTLNAGDDGKAANASQAAPSSSSIKEASEKSPEVRREPGGQDSYSAADARKRSAVVDNNQTYASPSGSRSVRPIRPTTLRGHLRRSGVEMKEAGKHLGSGAKHFGQSGGQAAEWAGKKMSLGAKAVGRALKRIF